MCGGGGVVFLFVCLLLVFWFSFLLVFGFLMGQNTFALIEFLK